MLRGGEHSGDTDGGHTRGAGRGREAAGVGGASVSLYIPIGFQHSEAKCAKQKEKCTRVSEHSRNEESGRATSRLHVGRRQIGGCQRNLFEGGSLVTASAGGAKPPSGGQRERPGCITRVPPRHAGSKAAGRGREAQTLSGQRAAPGHRTAGSAAPHLRPDAHFRTR